MQTIEISLSQLDTNQATQPTLLSQEELTRLLNKPDLSIESNHAIGLLVNKISCALQSKYQINPQIERGHPIVSLEDNYYALNYDKNEITLSSRYTKYITSDTILRTQMSSVIPSLLRHYKLNEKMDSEDKLWLCPGLVYRRDVRDKTHVGEPHQMDIWYLTKEVKTREDLLGLVESLISVIENQLNQETKQSVKKGKLKNTNIQWRYNETSHNYTDNGIEVEIYHNGVWLEILECGLISKQLLINQGLDGYSGLALGLGLERLVMIMKDIKDIRTLYSDDERIKAQLTHLNKYKEVSLQPSIKRDLSVAVDQQLLIEEMTENLVSHLNELTLLQIESISLVQQYSYESLPSIARSRLGMNETQKNMLIRIVLRDLSKSLTSEEANSIYNEIYGIIHKGTIGYVI